jgi:hypothetical protein
MTLIPEVEAALMDAIDRHQAKRGANRVPTVGDCSPFWMGLRRRAGGTRQLIAIGVSVLVTLAVVAVVLSAGHASRQTTAPAVRPSAVPRLVASD